MQWHSGAMLQRGADLPAAFICGAIVVARSGKEAAVASMPTLILFHYFTCYSYFSLFFITPLLIIFHYFIFSLFIIITPLLL
jgi:hypothetical protein